MAESLYHPEKREDLIMTDILKSPVVTGVGGVIVGLLVGALLSLSTIDSKIGASIGSAMDDVTEAVAGDEAALSEVTERLAALEASVSENSGEVTALQETVSGYSSEFATLADRIPSDLGDGISNLETRIDTVAADLGRRMSETASEQTAALRGALRTQPTPAAAPEPAPADEAVSEAGAAMPPELRMADGTRGIGETFVLAEGAVRAFVRRIDADGGTALLSINGAATPLAVGEAVPVSHGSGASRLGLHSVSQDGVRIGSDCDVPTGDGALGTAYGPGELAMLGDGQLRVFVSGIFGDEARLAINGLETLRVRVGEARDVAVGEAKCLVNVNGIRGNSVLLSGGCS